MSAGKYSIQMQIPAKNGGVIWHDDLRMQRKGEAFAKGMFFALRAFNGGGLKYRLVKHVGLNEVEVLEEYNTGNIKLN